MLDFGHKAMKSQPGKYCERQSDIQQVHDHSLILEDEVKTVINNITLNIIMNTKSPQVLKNMPKL